MSRFSEGRTRSLADGYPGHSKLYFNPDFHSQLIVRTRLCGSVSSRVWCVFITFVDYAYKNYTSPRSQSSCPSPSDHYKRITFY
ncbi:uncharacterized protein LOC26514230 isoform X1 [Drosophila ananassae]|uniref:uncharacterized protein LOC26514230 isoform X1 n=1 Tax=Drosophila ananassae TaxID=7217 RepID=UPI0013A5EFB1|nr:uncharacterized protein LOC26514230 isoform X1 [Drosophila ananassae]XP_032308877.1 uncharacterized protein LOC26514230 isoform X1 [Drosophila ananassae]